MSKDMTQLYGSEATEKALTQKSKMVGNLVEMKAKDLSDEELARCFNGVIGYDFCIRVTKHLIDTHNLDMSDLKALGQQKSA